MNFEVLQERWLVWNQTLQTWIATGSREVQWAMAGGVFFASLLFFYICKWIAQRRLAKLAEQTETGWDSAVVEAIRSTRFWLMAVLAVHLAGRVALHPSSAIGDLLQTAAVLAIILQSALWGNLIIDRGVQRRAERRLEDDPASLLTITALVFIGKVILFSLLLLLALSNLGINVSALITGLGIGGIAVALAVQNILSDLLASMSIVVDKPFVPGDFIIVGDQMGVVRHIGMKTTRLTSLSGEQLIFSNNDLLQSRIRNFKRMKERRAVFHLGVTYQTPAEILRMIPDVLRQAVEANSQVRFERAHFKDFGASSLNFEVVYHVLVPDMGVYLDIQQAINLTVVEEFTRLDIDFAYPTQTIFLQQEGAGGEAPAGGN